MLDMGWHRRTPYPGGAPANVACALAKLGTKVVFIGNLGQDDLGDQMSQLLTSKITHRLCRPSNRTDGSRLTPPLAPGDACLLE